MFEKQQIIHISYRFKQPLQFKFNSFSNKNLIFYWFINRFTNLLIKVKMLFSNSDLEKNNINYKRHI